jgi:hypothetical protein
MYDDLLGKPKKKEKKKITDIDRLIVPTGNPKNSIIKALNFKVDEKTPNGHVYPRQDMHDALTKAIKKNLWLVSKIDKNQDPSIVELADIIGRCVGSRIDTDGNIILNINYLKHFKPYRVFDITTASLGIPDKKGVVKGLIIIQLYMV